MTGDNGFCTCNAKYNWSYHKPDCKANELCTCGGVDNRSYDFLDVDHTSECLSRCQSYPEIVDKYKELLENYNKSQEKLESIMQVISKIRENE